MGMKEEDQENERRHSISPDQATDKHTKETNDEHTHTCDLIL